MLACAMARKVFTTASANEDEVDGPGAVGAVVAGPQLELGVLYCVGPQRGPRAKWREDLNLGSRNW